MSDVRMLARIVAMAGAIVTLPIAARAADVGAEIANARMHAGLAAQASSVAMVQTHLHHAINCLVGPGGAGFDAKQLNPCQSDGNGAIPDETDAAKKKALQAAADEATAGLGATDLATAQKDASSVASMLTNVK
jgi:hypothetical protein